MKNFVIGAVAALAIGIFGMAISSQAAPDRTVEICHFPGHDGDTRNFGGCEKLGGNVIAISINACEAHLGDAKACFDKEEEEETK